MVDRENEATPQSSGNPAPGNPTPETPDSLTNIFKEGFLTTSRVLHRLHKSGSKIVGEKIYREQVVAQERQEVEEQILVVGACGHSLPNDPYTIPGGKKVCSGKCAARCEYLRCQKEVPARELKEVGALKVCPRCYRFCRMIETARAIFRSICFWADKNG